MDMVDMTNLKLHTGDTMDMNIAIDYIAYYVITTGLQAQNTYEITSNSLARPHHQPCPRCTVRCVTCAKP